MSAPSLLPVPTSFRRRQGAAVAVVRRTGDGAVLFIRRARRAGDPWSGDVAFPGGWRGEADADPAEVARRETLEEVGLTLGEPIGALKTREAFLPRRGRFEVLALVFESTGMPLTPDPREVAAADWVPFRTLEARPRLRLHRIGPLPLPVPSLELSVGRLWGLTLDFTRELVRRGGRP